MLRLILPALALAVCAPAVAQMSEREYAECSMLPTVGIVECVAKKTEVWDTRLNKAYQALRQRIEPEQRQALLTAQRLWIQYRDANCGFYFAGPGTIRRIEGAQCLHRMTQQRTCELEVAQLGDGQPSPWCRQ